MNSDGDSTELETFPTAPGITLAYFTILTLFCYWYQGNNCVEHSLLSSLAKEVSQDVLVALMTSIVLVLNHN